MYALFCAALQASSDFHGYGPSSGGTRDMGMFWFLMRIKYANEWTNGKIKKIKQFFQQNQEICFQIQLSHIITWAHAKMAGRHRQGWGSTSGRNDLLQKNHTVLSQSRNCIMRILVCGYPRPFDLSTLKRRKPKNTFENLDLLGQETSISGFEGQNLNSSEIGCNTMHWSSL